MPIKTTFEDIEKGANDKREYRLVTLDNDLTALLISDPETEKSSAAANVHVGSWCDPEEALGLAHFLEHMLFLGTEKYPDENSYNVYLNQHGGRSNAFTDQEDTNYFFDVQNDFFEGALDIFAQFFISPLFTEAATDRELNAVDSENSKNLQADNWRLFQLYKKLARSDHPFHKFSTGNLKTLKEAPEQSGVNVRQRLLAFHAQYYSANVIKIVVLGQKPLDTLQNWVDEKFSTVPNKNLTPPVFPGQPYTPSQMQKLVKVVPVRDVRTLQLMWPLPSVQKLYRMKPMSYLGHLIGHESEGSVIALLKEKGWANELAAGISKSYSDFSAFTVGIELTDAGLEHVNDVITMVFQYIAMLNTVGPQEWVFDEIKNVAAASFRFQHKIEPMSYASSLASCVEKYEPAHVLAGRYLFYEYDASDIDRLLKMLTPDNLTVLVCNRSFEAEASEREQWYDTAYSISNLPAEQIADWNTIAPIAELHLPDQNPFIPSDFELKPRVSPVLLNAKVVENELAPPSEEVAAASLSDESGKKSREYPVRVSETDDVVFWFKQDNVFEMPKVNIILRFVTPVAYESPTSCAMTEVISRSLEETLNRYSYYADVANLSYSISTTRFGFNITVSGFHHKAPVLLSTILETLRTMEISSALFDRVKDQTIKNYRNFEFKQTYQHTVYFAAVCMEWPRWTHAEKCDALVPVTVEQTQAFKDRLLASLSVEALLNGNATPEDCRALATNIRSSLGYLPLPSNLEPENRVVMLESGRSYVYRRHVFNQNEANSGINNLYIVGPATAFNLAMSILFQQVVSEAFFDALRTKAQLGYIVHISRTLVGPDIYAIQSIIQSNKADPEELDSKIEEFFVSFRATCEAMPDEEFAANVAAVQQQLLEKPKNIGEETRQLWGQIESSRYTFSIREDAASLLKDMTKADVIGFIDSCIIATSTTRRKLSIQIYGADKQIPQDEADTNQVVTIKDIALFKRHSAMLGRSPPHACYDEIYDFTVQK